MKLNLITRLYTHYCSCPIKWLSFNVLHWAFPTYMSFILLMHVPFNRVLLSEFLDFLSSQPPVYFLRLQKEPVTTSKKQQQSIQNHIPKPCYLLIQILLYLSAQANNELQFNDTWWGQSTTFRSWSPEDILLFLFLQLLDGLSSNVKSDYPSFSLKYVTYRYYDGVFIICAPYLDR